MIPLQLHSLVTFGGIRFSSERKSCFLRIHYISPLPHGRRWMRAIKQTPFILPASAMSTFQVSSPTFSFGINKLVLVV